MDVLYLVDYEASHKLNFVKYRKINSFILLQLQ